jgi:hypothetical protein
MSTAITSDVSSTRGSSKYNILKRRGAFRTVKRGELVGKGEGSGAWQLLGSKAGKHISHGE